jgi:hypothetical protein
MERGRLERKEQYFTCHRDGEASMMPLEGGQARARPGVTGLPAIAGGGDLRSHRLSHLPYLVGYFYDYVN